MKYLLPTLVFSLIFSIPTLAQQPTPPPPPNDGDIVKISTNLIQVDVSVTDRNGHVVSDLRPDEIEIYENGKKQDISNFAFISNARATEQGPAKKPADTVMVPGRSVRPEAVRRTIALVVDDLTLSFGSTNWVRDALKKFVHEQMQDGDLVAIIRTGGGIGALQQFTADKRQLLAAIEKVKFNFSGTGRTGIFDPIAVTLAEQIDGTQRADGSTRDLRDRVNAERDQQRDINEIRESIFATGTLGAMNYIIRGMSELPGRKSIVLLSDGIHLFVRDSRGMAHSTRVIDSLRRLTDLANRAAVVIYTIDARGLVITGMTAQDNTWGLTMEEIEPRVKGRRDELFDSQAGLQYLAKQTGGFAIINSNDIPKGIRRVLDDQSYYLIGYQPDDETFDPRIRRYNKLEVKVTRPETRLRYRSGFFGVADDQIQQPKLNAQQAILRALTSPFAINDITLRMNSFFSYGEKREPYLRTFLHVDTGDLSFTRDANGIYKTVFELVAVSFGDNGVPVDEHSRKYTIELDEDRYQKMLRKGFVYHFTLPVKKPGGYQLRIALRDVEKNKVGSANQFVEIPNLKKDRLMLSGLVFEALDPAQWQKASSDAAAISEIRRSTDALSDTALRIFKAGSVVIYGVDAYNAKKDAAGKTDLTQQVKIYRDGKVFFEGPVIKIETAKAELERVTLTGVLRTATTMEPGEYVLQTIVTDNLAKGKHRSTSQFATFEITD